MKRIAKLPRILKMFICIVCIVIIFSVSYYFASISSSSSSSASSSAKNTKVVEKMTSEKNTNAVKANISDYIDVIYYINLDNRPDRNEEFLKEMDKIDFPKDKIIRIPAVYKKGQGSLGCSMSHIKTMELFIESGYENCIIFEDDFEFTQNNDEVMTLIKKLFENDSDFDVCMLSGWEFELKPIPEKDYIKQVIYALTTSGYIVSKKFAPTLLDNYKKGCDILAKKFEENPDYPSEYKYEIDRYWTKLQPDNKWYLFQPKVGKQRTSYSNIRERNMEYSF
jgi:GR25 family glycosyltransferase involved in LPS biosynthesis